MASSKKTAAKRTGAKKTAVGKGRPAKAAPAKKAAKSQPSTAAKKPYPDNTPDNTMPPKMRPNDAVDLLVSDHLAADKCFKHYETLAKKKAPAAQRKALAEKVCGMLKVHTRIEEEIFYPAARQAGLEDMMMNEAYIEHASAKELIAQIEAGAPDSDYYDAKVKVLGDYIGHHVLEEHTEMFPKCRRSKMDLVDLAQRMAVRKKALEAELAKGTEKPGFLARVGETLSLK
jgi:hypothetical protein